MYQLIDCLPAPFRTVEVSFLCAEWELEPVFPYWEDWRKGYCDIAQFRAYRRYEDMKEALWRDNLLMYDFRDFSFSFEPVQLSLFDYV